MNDFFDMRRDFVGRSMAVASSMALNPEHTLSTAEMRRSAAVVSSLVPYLPHDQQLTSPSRFHQRTFSDSESLILHC